MVSLDDILVDERLNYVEVEMLVAVLEREVRVLRNKEVPLVKVH